MKKTNTMKLPPTCPPIESWEEDPKTGELRISVSREWVEWFDATGIDDPSELQAMFKQLGLL